MPSSQRAQYAILNPGGGEIPAKGLTYDAVWRQVTTSRSVQISTCLTSCIDEESYQIPQRPSAVEISKSLSTIRACNYIDTKRHHVQDNAGGKVCMEYSTARRTCSGITIERLTSVRERGRQAGRQPLVTSSKYGNFTDTARNKSVSGSLCRRKKTKRWYIHT